MFGKPKDVDRVVESRALDRARWAIRDHGDEAEAFILRKLQRPNLSRADRVLHRLTLRAIEGLRRQQSHALVAQSSPAPQLIRKVLELFGVGARRKRRRRR